MNGDGIAGRMAADNSASTSAEFTREPSITASNCGDRPNVSNRTRRPEAG
jgi:hypothetical protein